MMTEEKGLLKKHVTQVNPEPPKKVVKEGTPEELPFVMFVGMLKNIKKQLPNKCTMLAPYKTSEGEVQIIYKIRGEKEAHYLTTPTGLVFMQADVEHIVETISKNL